MNLKKAKYNKIKIGEQSRAKFKIIIIKKKRKTKCGYKKLNGIDIIFL